MHSRPPLRLREIERDLLGLRGALSRLSAEELEAALDAVTQAIHVAATRYEEACPAARTPARARLFIAGNGRSFRLGKAPTVHLHRRRALHGILLALAKGARSSAGVSKEALLAAGWPNERVLQNAAASRVRTAIATLRRFGLRDVVITTGDGYTLDADVFFHTPP